MSEINYFEIEEALAALIRDDSGVKSLKNGKGAVVQVEEGFQLVPGKIPWVGIFLDTWDSPDDLEQIAGGTHFRTFLTFKIQLYAFGLKYKEAAKARDNLLQKVKEVLKKPANRKFSSVLITRFQGGEFDNQAGEDIDKDFGYFLGVSIELEAEVIE